LPLASRFDARDSARVQARRGEQMRWVKLRRHTDNDGDALTADGVAAAEAIARDRLLPPRRRLRVLRLT
jgi:hypothetical protein